MRAIIPVAGLGSRMRPHTHTHPKVLLTVAGKPMLEHILDSLIDAGITGVTLVVGYMGDRIEAHVRKRYPDLEWNFVPQEEMLGLGHAISITKEIHKDDKDLLIILGDTILRADFKKLFASNKTAIGVKDVEDPRRFGVVELNEDGTIRKMHEKPEVPPSNLAIVGAYKMNNPALMYAGLDHIIQNDIRTKKEFQLTDALEWMLGQGEQMVPFRIDGWLDCGKPETLFETNRELLGELSESNQREYQERYPDSVIISPVSIGEGTEIVDSVIGPNVVLGRNSKVKRSILEDIIAGDNAQITHIMLRESLIGANAEVEGRGLSLNIGDHSTISIG
ncbi:NTP transferase domain-containing protein [bacterium]|nr:NTP transferase domain-containing protein [bacterium]